MKSILRVIVSIFKTLIGIVNIILILVIVLNILNFILLKVQKRDYTTFLDYTYVIVESDEEYLGLEENDFLLTDLRKSAVKEDLILYQDNNNVEIGKVLEISSKDIIVESKGTEVTVNKESIIGTVIKVIPILGNILNMCSRLNSNRICHIPYALSDHEGSAEFNISHSTENSSLLSGVLSKYKKKILENVVNVNITTVDSFVQSNNLSRVDFIKADIEGSERQMLKGATQVLREFAPKLAICTYHYPDDPQVLEGIIKAANPQYKVIHKWKKLFAYV